MHAEPGLSALRHAIGLASGAALARAIVVNDGPASLPRGRGAQWIAAAVSKLAPKLEAAVRAVSK